MLAPNRLLPATAGALFLSLACLAQQPAPLPADRADGAAKVTETQLREWLGRLASEEFAGRGTGQEGYRLAAHYVADHFTALGLEPGDTADGDYLQTVPWVRTGPVMEQTALVARRGGEVVWQLGADDGLHGRASDDVEDSGRLVIAWSGTANGSDLAELELDGAGVIVVPVNHLVDPDSAGGPRGAWQALRNAVAIRKNVASAGGELVAIADDSGHRALGPFTATSGPAPEGGGRAAAGRGRMPAIAAIRRADLDALLGAAGEEIDLAAASAPAHHEVEGAEIALRIEVETTQAPAWNVLGILRGSDPELRDEFVGIGCHLDHLGVQGGTIHPGADDDASGSAGLMAVARMFAENPARPRRSLIFMAFCGEERGLIGSGYFARNPTVPLEQMVAELQIDMIGRNEEGRDESAADNLNSLHLVGTEKLSGDLHELCLRLNSERAGFDLEWDQEGVFYRSDHWNFAREGVPIAFLFTGFHSDYHQPTDTADKIDYGKLQRISTYVYDLAFELASADERPMIDAERWESLRRKGRKTPAAPIRE